MSKFTKRELEIMVAALALDKGIDFLTGGAINRWSRKQAINIVTKVLPAALRIGAVPAASIARSAVPLVTNPYVAGTALGLGALQTQPGQQLLEMAEDRGRMDRIRFEQALTDIDVKVKKTKSKFNRAVSAGMKAAKNSVSYGKKGVISAPKKVFSTVTKMASQINKARQGTRRMPKLPKPKGPRSLFNAIKKVLK
jgi:hypothetical protein